jgi:hypothetical protein
VFSLCAKATDITFTSSGTITDGNVYTNVYVKNNGTVVNMSGGQIGSGSWGVLGTIDNSIFNLSGGQISTTSINIGPLSTINVSAGIIDVSSSFAVMDDGSANFSGGNITAERLKTYPDSVINITGGNISFDYLDMLGGELNIYRGLLNVDNAGIGSPATVNIFGHGFNYDPAGQGILTGYLLDDSFFTIDGVSQSEYTRFNLIPEPMSLFIFGFGLLVTRLFKK